jgi:hypothetical protein
MRFAHLLALLAFASTIALAQTASTSRHAGDQRTDPVTITVDGQAQTAVVRGPNALTSRPTLAAPSVTSPAKDEDPKTQRIHELLDRAYALTEQLAATERSAVMIALVDVAGRSYPEKAKDWAVALWNTAKDLPDLQRANAQRSAITAIAFADPDKALPLLQQWQGPADTASPTDVRANSVGGIEEFAASMVFTQLERKHGIKVIPELQQAAAAMGSKGQYPYMAMSALMARATTITDDSDNKDLPSSIFRGALQSYQNSPSHSADVPFAQFLTNTWKNAPRELAIDAVTSVARNLLTAPDDDKLNGAVEVSGKAVRVTNYSDLALIRLMPVLKELNPALAAKVNEAKPQLAGANLRDFRGLGIRPTDVPPEQQAQYDRARKRGQEMRLARNDPDTALATASAMTDAGDKANLLAETAFAMAEDSPEDATKVLDQAQKAAADVKDQLTELRIIVTSARAARELKQQQRVRELTARGFELGSQLVRQQMDEHPETNGAGEALTYMQMLVPTAMDENSDGVLAIIDAVPYPMAKAMLYTTAARSLQWGGRNNRAMDAIVGAGAGRGR